MIGKIIGCVVIFTIGHLAGSDILVNLSGHWYSEGLIILIVGTIGSVMVMSDRDE